MFIDDALNLGLYVFITGVKMARLYIVTPSFNGLKFLEDYFKSLFSQTYQDFKIVFVENSVDYESIDYVKEKFSEYLDKIIFIKNPENYGFARGNNIGIRRALEDEGCEYVVCLNNDTACKDDFLEKLIQCAEDHPDAGSVQPKIIWGKNKELIDSVGLEYSKNGLGFNRGSREPIDRYIVEEEIFGCCAGACLYQREALEEIKIGTEFFDEDFFAYYEDFDLALRLKWAGWNAWFCPESVVYHYSGGTSGERSDFTVYHLWRNYTWCVYKNLPGSYIVKKSYLIILSEIFQIIINLLRRKPVIFKSKWDAYRDIGKFTSKKKLIKRKVDFKEVEKWFVLKWRE